MNAPSENLKINASSGASLNGSNTNGTGVVDINLDSEERDEFIEIKVRDLFYEIFNLDIS